MIMNHGDRDEILARADIEEIDWHTDQCAVCAEYPGTLAHLLFSVGYGAVRIGSMPVCRASAR